MKLWLLMFVLTFSAIAFAEDAAPDHINPFGTIEWSDSFGTVITKIKGIPGIDRVTVYATGSGQNGVLVTDANVNDPPALVLEAIKRWKGVYLEPTKLQQRPAIVWGIEKYLDDRGTEQSYPPASFIVEGSPVALSGAPFKITAEFHPLRGYAVVHPEGVVSAGGYRIPLALIRVTLASREAAVIAAAPDIEATLMTKYKRFDPGNHYLIFPDRSKGNRAVPVAATVFDHSGTSLSVSCCDFGYVIDYLHHSERKLEETYLKHVAGLTKTGPDQKKGL